MVLLDKPGISKFFHTLLLLTPHLCFIIGRFYDLFDARNDSWMRPNKYTLFTFLEAECQAGSWVPRLGSRKASLSPATLPQLPITDRCKAVLSLSYFLLVVMYCFTFECFPCNYYVSLRYTLLSLNNRLATFFGKELPTLLALCLFCGCLILFVYLSFYCSRLDVDLIVSVPEITFLLWPDRTIA